MLLLSLLSDLRCLALNRWLALRHSRSANGEGERTPFVKPNLDYVFLSPFPSLPPTVSERSGLVVWREILAGEVYANKLNEMNGASNGAENGSSGLGLVMAELGDCKRTAANDGNSLTSLREELEKTKLELNQLKTRESDKQVIIAEIGEDVKFAEESTEFLLDSTNTSYGNEFQKRRYVKFAEPPSLAQVLNINGSVLERQFSHVDREMPRCLEGRTRRSH